MSIYKMITLLNYSRLKNSAGLQVDFSNLPGNKTLIAGDNNAGFLGFVTGAELITGSGIAAAIGLSAGTLINSDTPWIKYIWKGKICYYPLKPLRHSVTWDHIYNAGAVYGTGDEGLFPPMSRGGQSISIDATDNSINTTNQNFLGDKSSGMDYADTVGAVGDTLVLKGWSNSGNNGEVIIDSITNTKIVVSGRTLVTETGGRNKRFYNSVNAVTQNASVTINDVAGKVRLMNGASQDQLSSYADADRDSIGADNEWNWIILQLHEQAKLKNWTYPAYADPTLGDFGVYLTDTDLITHYTLGSGSYRWMQETSDATSWRRVLRGGYGASYLTAAYSWLTSSTNAFSPVLEFPQTSTL